MAGQINGIGGFFFRAKDAARLAKWYKTHFGIPLGMDGGSDPEWHTAAGPCVFAPYDKPAPDMPTNRPFLLNFRVDDLDAILARLAKAGIVASNHHEIDDVGRFAWVYDPEGNPIELWEQVAD
ncbi:VOC family protein [Yoonia sp. R2331]|uniref:VOC family protein n=1 Tax=Yoonia sp. R2331 TaxID=3237238 RepID=UPI0034E4F384